MPQNAVLVTGASSGFGRATASLLAENGFRVLGTSRKPSGEREDGFEMLPLDIDSDSSVSQCISAITAKDCQVDVLINNAGTALTGALEETSIEEAKAYFETNFFGPVRMVNAVLPGMRERRRGQIINICSLAATFPVPFEGYYAAAKSALLVYTEALRQEVKSFNIRVSSVEPGFFRTNLGNSRKQSAKSIEDYRQMRNRGLSYLAKDFEGGPDPQPVAETVVRIVESASPRASYAVGKEKRYLLLNRILPASTMENLATKHWHLDA